MRKLFAVVALAALAACGSSGDNATTSPTPAKITGIYNLATVNGKPLPFIVQQDASSTRSMTAAEINLGSDGTWTETQTYKITGSTGSSTTTTYTMGGTYAVSGTTATLTVTTGASATLSLVGDASGNTLTLTDPGTVYVYTR